MCEKAGRTTTLLYILLTTSACGNLEGIAVGLPPDSADAGDSGDSALQTDDIEDTTTADTGSRKDGGGDTDCGDTGSDDTAPAGTDSATVIDSASASSDDTRGTESETERETGDTDSSTSEENPELTEIPLAFPDGWTSREENILGVQGSWNAYSDPGSSIMMILMNKSTICVWGDVQNTDPSQFNLYYGAKVGFDLCATARKDDPSNTPYSLKSCAWSPNLHYRLKGVAFNLAGTLPEELRLQFSEQNRQDGAYIVIEGEKNGEGRHIGLIEDAEIFYDTEAPPVNPGAVYEVMFYIHAFQGPMDFNFCISNILLLADL